MTRRCSCVDRAGPAGGGDGVAPPRAAVAWRVRTGQLHRTRKPERSGRRPTRACRTPLQPVSRHENTPSAWAGMPRAANQDEPDVIVERTA